MTLKKYINKLLPLNNLFFASFLLLNGMTCQATDDAKINVVEMTYIKSKTQKAEEFKREGRKFYVKVSDKISLSELRDLIKKEYDVNKMSLAYEPQEKYPSYPILYVDEWLPKNWLIGNSKEIPEFWGFRGKWIPKKFKIIPLSVEEKKIVDFVYKENEDLVYRKGTDKVSLEDRRSQTGQERYSNRSIKDVRKRAKSLESLSKRELAKLAEKATSLKPKSNLTDEDSETSSPKNEKSSGFMISKNMVIAALFLLMLTVGIYAYEKRGRKPAKKDKKQEQEQEQEEEKEEEREEAREDLIP